MGFPPGLPRQDSTLPKQEAKKKPKDSSAIGTRKQKKIKKGTDQITADPGNPAPAPEPKIVRSHGELTREFGVSLSAIRKWAAVGMPGRPGEYNVDQIRAWRESTFKRRPEEESARFFNDDEADPKSEKGQTSIHQDRARYIKAQADKEEANASIAKIDAKLKEGNFADLDDVNIFFSEFFTELRRLLSRIPVEMPPGYSANIRQQIRSDLDERLEIVLNQMHDWTLRIEELEANAE